MTELATTKKHNDLIYDIGMHKGEDTDFYLQKGFRVVGFEANPDLVDLNTRRFSDHIKEGQLTIVEGAITGDDAPGKIKFFKNDSNTEWGTIDENWANRNKELGATCTVIEVSAIDFAKCIEKFGIPYYMKVDIEGADLICLQQLFKFDLRPSFVSIESEKISFDNLIKEIDLLCGLGYDKFKAVQQANIHTKHPPNPPREGYFIDYTFSYESSGLFGRELDGTWKNGAEILDEYRSIFNMYRIFGDKTIWQKILILRKLLYIFSEVTNTPVPGWYDTHAKHFGEP